MSRVRRSAPRSATPPPLRDVERDLAAVGGRLLLTGTTGASLGS